MNRNINFLFTQKEIFFHSIPMVSIVCFWCDVVDRMLPYDDDEMVEIVEDTCLNTFYNHITPSSKATNYRCEIDKLNK